ncbi:hypothetical protein AMJ80_02885, partial [bacterium SM23_31]
MIEQIIKKAKWLDKRIVFPEGDEPRTLRAAEVLHNEKIVTPIILGNPDPVSNLAKQNGVDLSGITIIDPDNSEDIEDFAQEYYTLRKHKGISQETARNTITDPLFFGAMTVRKGQTDGSVAGAAHATSDVIRAAIQIIGLAEGSSVVSSFFLMIMPDGKVY